MGGKDNSDLIDELVNNNHIITQRVERVLRLVDRGIFVHPHGAAIAYRDAPYRSNNLHPGQIHISAPSIYCNVLEMLDLHKNQSFLNVGSGSGYFSAVVGFLLGENGMSHGIELHSNIIEHARESLHLFASQKFIAGFDWCRPQFVHGNAFLLKGISRRYDRIYVGAQIEHDVLALFSEMLKDNGIMIVPVRIEGETRFQQVKRTSEGIETNNFMHVSFAELVPPSVDDRVSSSPASRKRKQAENSTNPNDRVTEDLIACFKPNSLAVIASYAARKMISDPLRMALPIAIVQKVENKQTNSEAIISVIRRHERITARRQAPVNGPIVWNNENPNPPLLIIPRIDRMVWEQQQMDNDDFDVLDDREEFIVDPILNTTDAPPAEEEEARAQGRGGDQTEMERGLDEEERGQRSFDHEEEDEHWFQFNPFQRRTHEEPSTDDESSGEERRNRHCRICRRLMCICIPSLKHAATRVMNAHLNARLYRVAKAQKWVKSITRLTESHRKPRSFAEPIPTIFENNINVPCPNGSLTIEDWYLQRNRRRYITKLDMLKKNVRVVGRFQFQQEMNDYKESTPFSCFKKMTKLTFNDEQESIFRFERKLMDVLDHLPISQNVKRALKWNLYRDS